MPFERNQSGVAVAGVVVAMLRQSFKTGFDTRLYGTVACLLRGKWIEQMRNIKMKAASKGGNG